MGWDWIPPEIRIVLRPHVKQKEMYSGGAVKELDVELWDVLRNDLGASIALCVGVELRVWRKCECKS